MIKKILLLLLICSLGIVNAQFNKDAPWNNNLRKNKSTTYTPTFQDVQKAFNAYWKVNNATAKGSGYKPFKRWEYIWESVVNDEGYLPTTKDQWIAWENKKKNENKVNGADQSDWFPIGPQSHTNTGSWSSGQARVNAIIVDPNNANIWYVGTPAGGLWKSTDAGSTWSPLTDDLPQIGVSGIAIDYSNSNIVYISTGDDDGSDTSSAGVFKSTDGGETWSPTGLNPGNTPSSMNEIYIHPTNSNIIWVATNAGVYKSNNAGTNWTRTIVGNIKDIKLKPGDPNIIYAVTPSEFFKSTDAGDSFTEITNGIPQNSGRMVIDVTPANDAYVYLLSTKATDESFNGVYRSIDSGVSFQERNTATDIIESTQAYYDLALGVSSINEEEIYVGCLNVWKSTNGGSSFSKINSWSNPQQATYTHADIHTIRAFNNRIFVCSDGGIYASTDSGANFTDHTAGIQASQFYKIAVSKNNANKMVGGLQDNGGHAYNEGNGNWLNYYGADGMDTAIDSNNDDKYYGFIQSGRVLCISNNAGSNLTNQVEQPTGSSGNWVTPLETNSQGKVFAAYDKLYRLNDAETGWIELASLSGSADQMKIAPSNDAVMYISVNNILKRSDNTGVTINNVYTFGRRIKGIAIHNTNPNMVWVTTSTSVYYSEDGGDNFTNITKNLPVTDRYVFITDIVHHPGHEQDPIYIGTSIGVYRNTTGGSWTPFFDKLPTTIVNDLEINVIDNSITVATYGRGIWRSQLPSCISVAANQKIVVDGNSSQEIDLIRSCTGQTVVLETVVTKGDNPTYNWSGPNGFSSTESSVTLNNLSLNQNGVYNVTITAPDTCGDAMLTFTVDVGEKAVQPASVDMNICANERATLTASGSTSYKWYNTEDANTELATGASYTTPSLSENKTYYVAGTSLPIVSESIDSPGVDTATDYNRQQGLIFDTNDAILLESFTVSAASAGQRTIEVVNMAGRIIASKTLFLPEGESQAIVNLEIPKGKNNTIRLGDGLFEMKRTPPGNGVAYPYTSPTNIVSITGNTANAPEFYYFFYNWNFTSKGGHCESVRTPVNVIVDSVDMLSPISFTIDNGTPVNFVDGHEITLTEGADLSLDLPKTSIERTLTWTSPSGVTYNTDTVLLADLESNGAEEGKWSVTTTFDLEYCKNQTQTINFSIGIDSLYEDIVMFPNPAIDMVTIGSNETLENAILSIYDVHGRKIIDSFSLDTTNPNEIILDVQKLAIGTYFINIQNNKKKVIKRIVKQK